MMKGKGKILIEGFEASEMLELSKEQEIQALIFNNEPVIFSVGTSQILGQFKKTKNELTIILSHIEGGGEGVLLKLMGLFRQFAVHNHLRKINWIVHAVDCPKPNPKLRKILELKGFTVNLDPNNGYVYQKTELVKLSSIDIL